MDMIFATLDGRKPERQLSNDWKWQPAAMVQKCGDLWDRRLHVSGLEWRRHRRFSRCVRPPRLSDRVGRDLSVAPAFLSDPQPGQWLRYHQLPGGGSKTRHVR